MRCSNKQNTNFIDNRVIDSDIRKIYSNSRNKFTEEKRVKKKAEKKTPKNRTVGSKIAAKLSSVQKEKN